jgi:DNA-binding transcriptional LysR family regulator
MRIQSLEVFLTVARHGSVSGAARALRYTQSAVSRQIAALEAATGTRLFDRLARGVASRRRVARRRTRRRCGPAQHRGGPEALRSGRPAARWRFPTAVAALVPRAMARSARHILR